MISIPDILYPQHVLFDPPARTQGAILHLLSHALKRDPRICDWHQFCDSLRTEGSSTVISTDGGSGIFIPHTRTAKVTQIVMAAARMRRGLIFEELAVPIHYIFLFAVPPEYASDYLKIIRSVLQVFHDPEREASLKKAKTPEEFIAALAGGTKIALTDW